MIRDPKSYQEAGMYAPEPTYGDPLVSALNDLLDELRRIADAQEEQAATLERRCAIAEATAQHRGIDTKETNR